MDGTLYWNSTVKFRDMTDGLSNTLVAGERPPSANLGYGWWYAGGGQWDLGGGSAGNYPPRNTGSMDVTLGMTEINLWADLSHCPPGALQIWAGQHQ
jgi:hypothetical protein